MKQVIQSASSGELSLRDVPDPKVRAGHVLVRTRTSLISPGTERLVVAFAKKSLAAKARARPDLVKKVMAKARRDGLKATWDAVRARLDEPLPLGYSAAGEVVAVGAGLEGAFRAGQRVAVAGAGLANHAELNVVPRNLAAPVPDGVTDEEACFATLAAISMHGMRNLGIGLGDVVAVLGAGLVGLLAVRLLVLSGVRVVALDYDRGRLDLARRLGAELAWDLAETGIEEAVGAVTAGKGCDGILIAAATESSEPLETAAAIARDRARISMVGMTGTEFPFREFMHKELSLVVSRSYGPGRYDADYEGRGVAYPPGYVRWTETENLAECLRLMSPLRTNRLDVAPLITHRFDFAMAEDAYALVTGRAEPHLGVVLAYSREPDAVARPSFPAPGVVAGKSCVLGVIGAGAFARAVLLPELKKLDGVALHTVVTRNGATAEHAQTTFGFAAADTDAEAVFGNPDINAVLIATRHDSHAALTARALEAGKPVLVEKPLALGRAGINQVIAARNGSSAFFQVGFNRRFAPMAETLRRRLAIFPGSKFLILRVNAGAVPPGSWLNDQAEGGGRVLGEVCHFVDLARHLVGAAITSVQADAAAPSTGATGATGTSDDLSAALRFNDGSLATIAYTALGDDSYGKERIEAFAGGTVVIIDNFRSLTVTEDGRTTTDKARAQDKGHGAALKAFADAVAAGGPPAIDEAELIETSLATLALAESLQSGARINL